MDMFEVKDVSNKPVFKFLIFEFRINFNFQVFDVRFFAVHDEGVRGPTRAADSLILVFQQAHRGKV
jgi:hypothetical protein